MHAPDRPGGEAANRRTAPPLKCVIQKELQDPLAEKVLSRGIRDGSVAKMTNGSDRLIFRPRPAAVATDEAA